MRIDVLTLFPGILEAPLRETILGRARESGVLEVVIHDLRPWGLGRHRSVDDYPFGGGPGMVMRPEPFFTAVEAIQLLSEPAAEVVLLTPQGRRLDAALAADLAARPRLLMVCGRYEGVDERVREHLIDREVSVADVVLSGGEIPALVLIDAVARRIPGVLGAEASLAEESFDEGLLEYPQYTRPRDFRGWPVPPVLLSGDHGAVARWRRGERVRRTHERRPDLLPGAALTERERAFLADRSADGGGPFDEGLLEYPQYTRPRDFRGWPVPPVLLSGDHGAVARWRRGERVRRTHERRPDLLPGAALTERERAFLADRSADGGGPVD